MNELSKLEILAQHVRVLPSFSIDDSQCIQFRLNPIFILLCTKRLGWINPTLAPTPNNICYWQSLARLETVSQTYVGTRVTLTVCNLWPWRSRRPSCLSAVSCQLILLIRKGTYSFMFMQRTHTTCRFIHFVFTTHSFSSFEYLTYRRRLFLPFLINQLLYW